MEGLKKDVWLSIHAEQNFDGCDKEEIDLVTQARLYCRNGKYYIAYDESELTGMEGTRTTVKLEKDRVAMIRTGTYPGEMLFLEHERHVGLYHTAFGKTVAIATHTSRIANTIGADGGELEIDYTIEVDQHLMGCHHFYMAVSTQPQNEKTE